MIIADCSSSSRTPSAKQSDRIPPSLVKKVGPFRKGPLMSESPTCQNDNTTVTRHTSTVVLPQAPRECGSPRPPIVLARLVKPKLAPFHARHYDYMWCRTLSLLVTPVQNTGPNKSSPGIESIEILFFHLPDHSNCTCQPSLLSGHHSEDFVRALMSVLVMIVLPCNHMMAIFSRRMNSTQVGIWFNSST